MATSQEAPHNPLRPYYKRPSIGIPQEIPNTTTSIPQSIPAKNATTASMRASARDMFGDLDYSDYLSDSSPSSMKMVKDLLDQALLKYTSVLLAQPFDVAKTVLQIRSQTPTDGPTLLKDLKNKGRRGGSYRESQHNNSPSDEDSDLSEPEYFHSSNSNTHYNSSRRRQHRDHERYRSSSRSPSPTQPPAPPVNQLVLKRPDSMLEVIGQLWQKEAAWGVWKGTNTTFVYGILLKTLESWVRGVLSALMNVPDSGILAGISSAAIDVGESPYPWAALGVAVAAAAIASIALAPLDLIRTKLIITPTSSPKRGLFLNLRSLPSYICSPALFIPTLLHSLVTPIITHSTPLFLRSRLGIDPTLTPTSFSIAKIASSTLELFLKLPLETVLRRGQVAVLASQEYIESSEEKNLETIVEVGPYKGVMGTMWSIIKEEGTTSKSEIVSAAAKKNVRKINRPPTKGQGIDGLWRGWRVGMWGILGLWGAEMMGGSGGSGGGEF